MRWKVPRGLRGARMTDGRKWRDDLECHMRKKPRGQVLVADVSVAIRNSPTSGGEATIDMCRLQLRVHIHDGDENVHDSGRLVYNSEGVWIPLGVWGLHLQMIPRNYLGNTYRKLGRPNYHANTAQQTQYNSVQYQSTPFTSWSWCYYSSQDNAGYHHHIFISPPKSLSIARNRACNSLFFLSISLASSSSLLRSSSVHTSSP